MVENGPSQLDHQEHIQESKLGKFGDSERIMSLMLEGSPSIVGRIEDIIVDVPDHANEVLLTSTPEQHVNEILGVRIQKDGEGITCVFKPFDGENGETKNQTQVKSFYPRECAAYMISEHFGLGVVPPTCIREINGRIGSIQLFLDHDYFKNLSRARKSEWDEAEKSSDWRMIAVLDWILANCERHEDNTMIDRENPTNLAAIDHGIILSSYNYYEMALRGPSLQLTHDNANDKPLLKDIPEIILQKIAFGYSNMERSSVSKINLLYNFKVIIFYKLLQAVFERWANVHS